MNNTDHILTDLNKLETDLKNLDNNKYKKWLNSSFRRITDKDDPYFVYENQLITSKICVLAFIFTKLCELNNKFDEKYNRALIIVAQMQSGKSGTFSNIIYIIFKNEWIRTFLNIEHCIVGTPMASLDLIHQLENDVKNISCSKYIKNNTEQCLWISHAPGLRKRKNQSKIKIFSKDTLFIVDEVDYASSTKQTIDKTMKKMGFTNNGRFLNINNIFMIAVSATPYAELYTSNLYKKKTIIPLKPGDNYYSCKKMFEEGKIYQYFDLNKPDIFKKFLVMLNKKFELTQNHYGIVRIPIKKYNSIIQTICDETAYHIMEYNGEKREIFEEKYGNMDSVLSKKPQHNTLICVKHYWRAGKQLDTNNVLFVHDYHGNTAGVDTVAQSLLGRCCGYNKSNIRYIYTDKKKAQEFVNITESDYKEIPSKARHTKKSCINKRIIYEENNISQWPSTYEECNDIIATIFPGEKTRFNKKLNKNRYEKIGEFFSYSLYKRAHSLYNPKIWDITEFNEREEFFIMLKNYGAINKTRPKYRFPVKYNEELRWCIVYWGGVETFGIVNDKASCSITNNLE